MTRRILHVTTALSLGAGLALAAAAPAEETQGDLGRLLFVHVPVVIAAYAALATGMAAALFYIIRRSPAADRVSASAVEIGTVFTGLTLLTGMIWGRPTWGVWWDWGDARMMSTAVLFFFCLSYLALRRSITDPARRAVRCSALALIAFAQVPIVHFSVQWFRTLHQGPTILRPDLGAAPIDPVYGRALGVMILAFLFLFASLLAVRLDLARREAAWEEAAVSSEPAGRAVAAPELGNPGGAAGG